MIPSKPPLLFLCLSLSLWIHPSQQIEPIAEIPSAINPERSQLISEALTWLTLRFNGVPLPPDKLKPFHDVIVWKYMRSMAYRTVVIAFQQSVLPKLTLKENEDCDPSYRSNYRDPYNNSVTYYFQKKFLFDNFHQPHNPTTIKLPKAYCDYRQGLECSEKTKKCECPQGAKMETISIGSIIASRCAMQQNMECGLADMAHDISTPAYQALKNYIAHMIFDWERPLSCISGTACRTKDVRVFRCYSLADNNNNWLNSPNITLPYGMDCTVGLHATPGMCASDNVCYYFGPRAKPGPVGSVTIRERVGFCTREYGAIGPIFTGNEGTSDGLIDKFQPFLLAFVNQRTIPFREKEFVEYQKAVFDLSHIYRSEIIGSGSACSVAKTQGMKNLLKFYSSLDKDPPVGKDFVADEATLKAKLEEGKKNFDGYSVKDRKRKMCKIHLDDTLSNAKGKSPFNCVSTGAAADPNGNDGVCKEADETSARVFQDKIDKFFKYFREAEKNVVFEDSMIDNDILSSAESDPDPYKNCLEHCPQNFACFEDYRVGQVKYEHFIYDRCDEIIPRGFNIQIACHNPEIMMFGECEKKILEGRKNDAIEKLHEQSKLERGSACDVKAENLIRNGLSALDKGNSNNYEFLGMLERAKRQKGGLCDATKLLKCTDNGGCSCVDGTGRRVSQNGRHSKHCYLASGSCQQDVVQLQLIPMTDPEKDSVREHYGRQAQTGGDCHNVCIIIKGNTGECEGSPESPWSSLETDNTLQQNPLAPPNPYNSAPGVAINYSIFRTLFLGISVIFSVGYS